MKIVRLYSMMLKQSHDYMFILCDFFGHRNSTRSKGKSAGSSCLRKYACFWCIFTICFS